MTLTCKHVPANAQQIPNLQLLVKLGKTMGANNSQLAGAMATMIQESNAVNLSGGDRDSAGLFQQRPSMGWGSYAQATNPTYAINKFLSKYMPLVKQGVGLFDASDRVQGSAYPAAPAQWYSESVANVNQLTSGKDFIDATTAGMNISGGMSTTRVQPYEFSRGSAGQRETSWDCMGRLASEVNWERFMRDGALWFVSDTWLKNQPPRFAMSEGARGVLSITFDSDARRAAAEMSVSALAKRWAVRPGDVVTVSGEGPGDGLWLVSDTTRSLWDDTTQIQLKRPVAPKPEPANTTTTTTVAGVATGSVTGSSAPALAQRFYAACKAISDRGYPYVYGGGHGAVGTPSGGGYDCSGSVCAALGAVNLGYRPGGACAVSGTMATSWGVAGRGKTFTVWANPEHVWVQFYNFPAWRFDTSPHDDGPPGPRLRHLPRSTDGFTPRHWPGL